MRAHLFRKQEKDCVMTENGLKCLKRVSVIAILLLIAALAVAYSLIDRGEFKRPTDLLSFISVALTAFFIVAWPLLPIGSCIKRLWSAVDCNVDGFSTFSLVVRQTEYVAPEDYLKEKKRHVIGRLRAAQKLGCWTRKSSGVCFLYSPLSSGRQELVLHSISTDLFPIYSPLDFHLHSVEFRNEYRRFEDSINRLKRSCGRHNATVFVRLEEVVSADLAVEFRREAENTVAEANAEGFALRIVISATINEELEDGLFVKIEALNQSETMRFLRCYLEQSNRQQLYQDMDNRYGARFKDFLVNYSQGNPGMVRRFVEAYRVGLNQNLFAGMKKEFLKYARDEIGSDEVRFLAWLSVLHFIVVMRSVDVAEMDITKFWKHIFPFVSDNQEMQRVLLFLDKIFGGRGCLCAFSREYFDRFIKLGIEKFARFWQQTVSALFKDPAVESLRERYLGGLIEVVLRCCVTEALPEELRPVDAYRVVDSICKCEGESKHVEDIKRRLVKRIGDSVLKYLEGHVRTMEGENIVAVCLSDLKAYEHSSADWVRRYSELFVFFEQGDGDPSRWGISFDFLKLQFENLSANKNLAPRLGVDVLLVASAKLERVFCVDELNTGLVVKNNDHFRLRELARRMVSVATQGVSDAMESVLKLERDLEDALKSLENLKFEKAKSELNKDDSALACVEQETLNIKGKVDGLLEHLFKCVIEVDGFGGTPVAYHAVDILKRSNVARFLNEQNCLLGAVLKTGIPKGAALAPSIAFKLNRILYGLLFAEACKGISSKISSLPTPEWVAELYSRLREIVDRTSGALGLNAEESSAFIIDAVNYFYLIVTNFGIEADARYQFAMEKTFGEIQNDMLERWDFFSRREKLVMAVACFAHFDRIGDDLKRFVRDTVRDLIEEMAETIKRDADFCERQVEAFCFVFPVIMGCEAFDEAIRQVSMEIATNLVRVSRLTSFWRGSWIKMWRQVRVIDVCGLFRLLIGIAIGEDGIKSVVRDPDGEMNDVSLVGTYIKMPIDAEKFGVCLNLESLIVEKCAEVTTVMPSLNGDVKCRFIDSWRRALVGYLLPLVKAVRNRPGTASLDMMNSVCLVMMQICEWVGDSAEGAAFCEKISNDIDWLMETLSKRVPKEMGREIPQIINPRAVVKIIDDVVDSCKSSDGGVLAKLRRLSAVSFSIKNLKEDEEVQAWSDLDKKSFWSAVKRFWGCAKKNYELLPGDMQKFGWPCVDQILLNVVVVEGGFLEVFPEEADWIDQYIDLANSRRGADDIAGELGIAYSRCRNAD